MVEDNEIRITEPQSADSPMPEVPKTRSIFTDWDDQRNRDLGAKSEREAKSIIHKVYKFVTRGR